MSLVYNLLTNGIIRANFSFTDNYNLYLLLLLWSKEAFCYMKLIKTRLRNWLDEESLHQTMCIIASVGDPDTLNDDELQDIVTH